MKNTPVYNQDGKEVGVADLPDALFGLPWKENLVHQVIVSMRSNQRANTAHAKTRGEVSGGGKKPWRQKGTGRARHGSTRSPLWVGGGVAHGPRNERNYSKKINKHLKTKALFTILSRKFKDGEMLLIDDINLPDVKTKYAQKVLSNLARLKGFEKLSYKVGKRAIIYNAGTNSDLIKTFRNIKSVHVEELRNINPLDAIQYKYVIMLKPKKSLELLQSKG